ncbi:MAG: tetratricopeptide repeat protein [Saprospiraceae bacterium]|nr:tetratricopeptide repeat protein [Saprospiraceae bacterium]
MRHPNWYTVFLLLFASSVQAQESLTIQYSCNFAAAPDSATALYTYAASAEARQVVERIMRANVLPQNFVLRAADCQNALATTIGKQRLILYSTSFLEHFKTASQTQWAAYCVLAHEIGHHLSNHDLEQSNPAERKRYELEADRFAGGTLFRLGATLEQAQAGINTFSSETTSTTHPPKRARLEAIAVGWKQAEELHAAADNTAGSAAEDSNEKKLYQQARSEKDPYKAIELLDQAIELREDYAEAYLERGKRKVDIEQVDEIRVNFRDAIEDYNTYLQLRPKSAEALVERGYAYRRLDLDSLALADYNRAIRLDNKNPDAYLGRAWVKMKTEDSEAALRDLDKALQLKPDFAQAWYWRGNIQYGFGEYDKAIGDLSKALEADPKYADALDLRAGAYQFSNKLAEAIADYRRLEVLDPAAFSGYFDRGKCYQALGKHREAIADFEQALQKNNTFSEAYLYRGVSKYALGRKTEGEQDFEQALANTVLTVNTSVKIGCLLVENGLPKDGLVWLDRVLAKSPENKQALECREKAKGK